MRPVDTLLVLTATLLWGLNFPVAKTGLEQFPTLLFMALRFSLVAALLLPLVAVPRGRMIEVLGLAFTLGLVHFAFMFTGLRHVDAAVAAVTVQIQVPFAALLAALLYKEGLGWRRFFGMAVAIAGVAVLAGAPHAQSAWWAVGLIVCGAFVWAVANMQMKRLADIGGFALNGWMGLFAVPQLALASMLVEHDQLQAVTGADWLGWGALAYQAIVVVIICYGIWFRLLSRYTVNQVMPYTLLVPVFGVLSGVVLLDEPVTWSLIFGGAATIAGVATIVLAPVPPTIGGTRTP